MNRRNLYLPGGECRVVSGEQGNNEENNARPDPVRYALCALLLRRGAAAEESPSDRVSIGDRSAADSDRSEAIRLALRERGYIEGQNIAIEYRSAEGKFDRAPVLLAELVRLKVDIIVVAGGTPVVRAAKNATKTIPIVMVGSGLDPVGQAWLTALPVPAATSPALQTLTGN